MKMLFERIGRLLQELDERRYPQEVPVESWKMKQTRERFSPEKGVDHRERGRMGCLQPAVLGLCKRRTAPGV